MQTGARPAPSDKSASAHTQYVAGVENASLREGGFRDDREALAWLGYELATAKQKLERSEHMLNEVLDSDSWRVTKPLRALFKKFPNLASTIRASLKATVHFSGLKSRKIESRTLGAQESAAAQPQASPENRTMPAVDPGLNALLNNCPAIHGKGTYGLERETLKFLDRHVAERSKTLETGCGLSTLLFAFKGALHTCVTPWEIEVQRITRYCAESGVSTDRLNFAVGSSDEVLPSLLHSGPLDLALIDGCHGFPMPFVDWLYCASRLETGGILIVDDTHLWTGAVLRDFLLSESDWKVEASFARGVAFRKVGEFRIKEWEAQPYVLKQSGQTP